MPPLGAKETAPLEVLITRGCPPGKNEKPPREDKLNTLTSKGRIFSGIDQRRQEKGCEEMMAQNISPEL